MEVTRQELATRYAQLSDKDLVQRLRSGDLTELAQMVARAELLSRGLPVPDPSALPDAQEAEEELLDPARGELRILAEFESPTEAHVLQALMKSEGVPAYVIDVHTAQARRQAWNDSGNVRLMVPERDLAHAQEILEAYDRGDFALSDDEDADEESQR